MLYTIQDTTLTALGDAVRSKVIGTSEIPAPINKENLGMTYNVSNRSFELPSFVKKTKIIGSVDYTLMNGSTVPSNGLQGLGVASGTYSNSGSARDSADFIVINEGVNYSEATGQPTVNYNFDFEIVIEGNSGTFACTQNNSLPGNFHLSYTAIGLDENGNEFKYTPLEMVDVINGLEIPNIQPIVLTGNQSYGCAGSLASSYVSNFGDTITTKDITNMNYMFFNYKNETIPFEVNAKPGNSTNIVSIFSGAVNLKELPKMNNITVSTDGPGSLFQHCNNLRNIPEDYFDSWDFSKFQNYSYSQMSYIFGSCYSLRNIPSNFLKNIWTIGTSSYYTPYPSLFQTTYSLDAANNLAVAPGTQTSNCFSYFINGAYRLKSLTFNTNEDGTPIVAPWKNQTIDMSAGKVGYGYSMSQCPNSGITADKEVKDDATYQALKNDKDWFTKDINYSRYNHDSAVETINSLPDTSAYLSANGGTNTIKFKGAAGALTDGGAINTLTEEEIAVAAAKGWTVTLA